MSFSITNSFLEEFDYMFYPYLQQNGSQLMNAVTQEEVHGAVKYMRQQLVGDAHFRTGHGDTTEYTSIMNDRRMLKPRAFACPIMLDDIDMVMQGTPDPGQLAQQAANSCGKLLDKIIIQGIGGANYTESSGEVNLSKPAASASTSSPAATIEAYDKTNTIAWNDYTLGGNMSDTTMSVVCGLNTSKIAKAVQKLQSKFNYPPIVCVASSYALSTLRADPRMASTDFNNLHALADAQNPTYAGVNAFVASELVDGDISHIATNTGHLGNGNKKTVEYAYVYCMNNVKLGCSMPLSLKNGTNAERYLNDVIIYQGMYDCTRMFEDSVVRIEILKNVAEVKPEAIAH